MVVRGLHGHAVPLGRKKHARVYGILTGTMIVPRLCALNLRKLLLFRLIARHLYLTTSDRNSRHRVAPFDV